MRRAIESIFQIGEKHYRKIMVILFSIQFCLLFFSYLKNGIVYAPDSPGYIVPAKNLLLTGRLIDEAGDPIIFRTPGYSCFLAVIYYFTQYNDGVVIWLQIFMVLTMTYMIYYLTSEISEKKICGCLACFFYICDMPVYTNVVCIMTDTLFPFLLVLAFALFYRYWKYKKISYFVLSVLSLNLAMLVRPQSMYYNMILVVTFVILAILKRVRWRECLIYCMVFSLIYGGWTFRNYCVYGDGMYTSIRAESYYRWFGPQTMMLHEGITSDEADTVFEEMMDKMYPNFESLSKLEKIYAQKDVGVKYIKTHIISYLLLNIKGLVAEMIAPDMPEIYTWNLPVLLYWSVCCVFAGLLLLSYLIYAVSFLRTIRRQTWLDWFILFTVIYLMASTAVLGYCRYRLAFYPLCLIGTFSCWKRN